MARLCLTEITDRCAKKVATVSHLVLDFQQNLCKEGNPLWAAVGKMLWETAAGIDTRELGHYDDFESSCHLRQARGLRQQHRATRT